MSQISTHFTQITKQDFQLAPSFYFTA